MKNRAQVRLVCLVTVVCLITGASFKKLAPVSLDGTTGSSLYQSGNYTFVNGDFARGFVRLNGGFTVPAAATVLFNIVTPVAGTIDLNSSGQITLEGDVSLASGATLVTGGKIDGQGYSVFLNGNLTIPAGQTIECVGNTVIDGQGHELFLASGAPGGRIFVNGPSGTTVTLRNMIIRGLEDYGSGDRGIKFGTSTNQTLILENVTIHLGGNYIFVGGKLDIKGFVAIDGWNTFEYKSSNNCTIQKDSTLFVDMHTRFKYNPNDGSRIHLVMTDKTSRLFLHGCTLDVVKSAGLLLTKGHLIIDHSAEFFGHGAVQESEGIAFGTGIAGKDLHIDILPGANIDLNEAFLTYENQD